MNLKDEDVCSYCIKRRQHRDCGYEPEGFGPDMDGEYGVCCEGQVSPVTINNSAMTDVLDEYHGIGDPIPWDMLYPVMIWSGMNWLDHTVRYGFIYD